MVAIVLLLIFVLIVATLIPRRERFQTLDATSKIVTSNRLNYEHLYPDRLMSIVDKAWAMVLFKLYTNQKLDLFGNPKQIILHPLDYIENVKQPYPKEEIKGFYLFLTSEEKAAEISCGFDLSGRKVGYFDRCEKRLIDSISFGYRQKTTPVLLPLDKLDKLDSVWSEVDLIILYIVPKSPLLRLVEKQYLTVLDIRNISLPRLQLTNNMLTLEELYKREVFEADNRLVTSGDSLFVLSIPMYLVTLSIPPPTAVITSEPFITRLEMSSEFTDPNYRCVGDETIQSKMECQSPYSKVGEPKTTPTFMDKPCTKNEDCPYYRANKNYSNDFGRCMPDGKCQMPTGVLLMGYTKQYNRGEYAPFCYGCTNPRDTMCCEDQAVLVARKQSPLKSPDYAFAGDTELRTLNKLPTYIPLL